MEAPTPVGAGEPGAMHALDLVLARLRRHRGMGVDRMLVGATDQDRGGIDVLAAIEGDHQWRVHRQPLQLVHAVTDRAGARRIRRQVGIPRRPRLAPTRQQRGIGMQHRVVGLVFDRTEDLALSLARVIEQRQRLVAVAGQHHLVEAFVAGIATDRHALRIADHAAHRLRQAHAHVPARGHGIDIGPRTAPHHAPRRPPGKLQHVMVGHELDQVAGREREDSGGRRRPQCAGHRHQVLVAEGRAVAVGVEVIAQ